MNCGPNPLRHGTIQQKGVGAFTLCKSCNNNTGKWYGSEFANFCRRGKEALDAFDHAGTTGLFKDFFLPEFRPLRVIKQVLTMFMSVAPEVSKGVKSGTIAPLLLNRTNRAFPSCLRFFLYFNSEGHIRHIPMSVKVEPGRPSAPVSEFSFPPFGYMLSYNGNSLDKRLFEITHFANYEYDQVAKGMTLRLPVLPTHLAVPGDYRTKDQIDLDWAANQG